MVELNSSTEPRRSGNVGTSHRWSLREHDPEQPVDDSLVPWQVSPGRHLVFITRNSRALFKTRQFDAHSKKFVSFATTLSCNVTCCTWRKYVVSAAIVYATQYVVHSKRHCDTLDPKGKSMLKRSRCDFSRCIWAPYFKQALHLYIWFMDQHSMKVKE